MIHFDKIFKYDVSDENKFERYNIFSIIHKKTLKILYSTAYLSVYKQYEKFKCLFFMFRFFSRIKNQN